MDSETALEGLEYATGYERMYGVTDEQLAFLKRHQANLQRFDIRPCYDPSLDAPLERLALKRDELVAHGFAAARESGNLYEAFRIDFVHATTALEGNTLSLLETGLILQQDLTAPSKPMKDHLEVIDASRAFERARKAAKEQEPLTEALVKDLHRIGSTSLDETDPGEYRWDMRYVSTSPIYPPPAKRVPELMRALVADDLAKSPVANAALFHLVFEDVHPFGDGNGRTGRVLLNYQLMMAGYPPIVFKADQESASRYYGALSRFMKDVDGRDGTEFVHLVIERVDEELDKRLAQLALRLEREEA
ncbi:Fic family protein [Rubneribacter sp.]|nr:Fic family protein [Candidatus Rubneribacter avistercoris]